ncbi:MAG: amino acid ABC transporter, partial [Clostridia bacterium]|nr:amino acid ABC transporter [Clostridia bacterium]
MKKALALIMVLVLAVCCFAGCSGKKTEDNTEKAAAGLTLASLKEKGELVVATSPDFPPFES